jgi:hypothetical protein
LIRESEEKTIWKWQDNIKTGLKEMGREGVK